MILLETNAKSQLVVSSPRVILKGSPRSSHRQLSRLQGRRTVTMAYNSVTISHAWTFGTHPFKVANDSYRRLPKPVAGDTKTCEIMMQLRMALGNHLAPT